MHDLEHGYVVVAYSCANGCPSQAELDAMRQAMDNAPQSDTAKTCGEPNSMFVVRFDSMTSRFAYIAWDRVQLTDTFDAQAATTFMQQWQDQANPEQHPAIAEVPMDETGPPPIPRTMRALVKEAAAPGATVARGAGSRTRDRARSWSRSLAASVCGTDVHIERWDPVGPGELPAAR